MPPLRSAACQRSMLLSLVRIEVPRTSSGTSMPPSLYLRVNAIRAWCKGSPQNAA